MARNIERYVGDALAKLAVSKKRWTRIVRVYARMRTCAHARAYGTAFQAFKPTRFVKGELLRIS